MNRGQMHFIFVSTYSNDKVLGPPTRHFSPIHFQTRREVYPFQTFCLAKHKEEGSLNG